MPERFRGRLLLRRWAAVSLGATLSRAAIPSARRLSVTRGALAGECDEVNAPRRENLTRGVVLQLILGELKADEMLEGRVGNGRANAGLGQRIDRRVDFPGLARAGQDLPDVLRESRGAAIDANASARAGGGVLAARRKVPRDGADLLGGDDIAAAQRHVEIG